MKPTVKAPVRARPSRVERVRRWKRRIDRRGVRLWGRRRLSGNAALTLGVVAVALATLAVVVVANRIGDDGAGRLVRADSHRLSDAGSGAVTVVEFLDFECVACGAVYPDVEKLRREYDGKITYVVRYFPLPGHANGLNAARAAQAAANQGQFEAMYHQLFASQSRWGDQQRDHADTFASIADQLGLDMARYQADVADSATTARIGADRKDGLALGVDGTPAFFIDGERYDGPRRYSGLKDAVDTALAG